MTAGPMTDPARFLDEHLAQASPDLLREMLGSFINTLMSAEADAVCGAAYGQSSPERVNVRNGYRHRDFAPPRFAQEVPPPAPARSTSRSPSCAPAPASPTGCWSGASGPNGR